MEQSSEDKSKEYSNIKLYGGIAKGIVSFLLIFLFVYSGLSRHLVLKITSLVQNDYLSLLLFIFSAGIISSIIFFPAKYYLEYYIEHKYSLSNQTFGKWLWEDFKEFLVGSAIGVPILLLFFLVLKTFGSLWWLPFAILMFIISVLLAKILPVLILPLFYKVVPIQNEELKERIMKLSLNAGMNVENVYTFNMSKNTKKANAAFTGLGKTKRILLGDTLIENYSNDEIETVIAHELGHYKKKHIVKNIILGTFFSFLTFYLIARFYDMSLNWFGFAKRTEIAALPVMLLWGMIIGVLQTPLSNFISRKFEYEADEYAVKATGNKKDFIATLSKLTEQNLSDKAPHPFVEWFFYSHPSIERRKNFIENLP